MIAFPTTIAEAGGALRAGRITATELAQEALARQPHPDLGEARRSELDVRCPPGWRHGPVTSRTPGGVMLRLGYGCTNR